MLSHSWRRPGPFMLVPLLAALFFLVVGCDKSDNKEEGPDTTVGEDVEIPEDTGNTPDDPDVTVEPDVCAPDCDGKACGDDGCGGICGHCYTMEGAQNDDLCLADGTCTVCGCGEKKCGTDACGSPCGTCPGAWVCNEQFQCEPPPIQCDYKGFHDVSQYGKLTKEGDGGFTLHFEALNEEEPPFDVLVMDTDSAAGGPLGPGSYDLALTSFHEGGIYLYVLKNWNGNGYEQLFVPTEGTLEITVLDAEAGLLEATLQDVILEEATYNAESDAPDFVAHGEVWCLNGIQMETDLNVTKEYCVEEGTGPSIGDNIADFQLQRCDGQWVNLHDKCSTVKALWIVATAGW